MSVLVSKFNLARTLETGLKWMTGILSSVAILLFIFSIFCACYLRRISLHPETRITFRKSDTRYNEPTVGFKTVRMRKRQSAAS